jgi:microsomal dipeptidase-like Zn-dependent dipeptidase
MSARWMPAAVAIVVSLAGTGGAQARSRYSLAHGCFAIVSAAAPGTAKGPFFFQPTGLGRYLLADERAGLLAAGGATTTTPGPAAEWTARPAGRRLTLRNTRSGELLEVGGGTRLAFVTGHGCRAWPEAQLDATGRPFRGTRRDGTVRGFAEAHFHPTADLRAGGQVISGEAFDRFGITEALGRDAEVHGPDGSLDITGNLLRSGSPAGTHDTAGWPGFTGWPTYDTNTHQQVYYRWLERSYLAGMRLAVAQLVEDAPLCNIEPRRSHSCDETSTVQLSVRRLLALQDYIDAQSGGPGRGWLRLVYDPAQARRVIRAGKLAMVVGVEASDPFGCSERLGQPDCDRADVDRGLQLYEHLGIRAMFITHWVDNAFGGAALEGGDKGTFISTFQLSQTGTPFSSGACPEEGEGEDGQCNTRGLTDLGRYLVERLIDAHMLIEADHLSEQSRRDVFELAEARGYPLVSSHNGTGGRWVPSQLRRLQALGGYVSTTLDDAPALAAKVDGLGRYGFRGVGLGSDTGGFNSLPGPASSRLTYPFRSYDGRVTFGRQRTGTRVFDINADGVAHYGLLPDLLAGVQRSAGGKRAMSLLFHSAEAYLRTWERAERR